MAATTPPPARSWYKRNEIALTPWLFLLPAMLFFAVYVIIPIGQSVAISFYQWDGLGEKTFVGTANYERLLGIGDQKMDRKFEIRSGTTSNGWCCICWRCLRGCSSPCS